MLFHINLHLHKLIFYAKYMKIELKILEIMNEKGISIETLKDKIEENGESLSRTSISRIINNRSVPKIDTLKIIADALGVSIHRLFNVKAQKIHLIINDELQTFNTLEELNEYLKDI